MFSTRQMIVASSLNSKKGSKGSQRRRKPQKQFFLPRARSVYFRKKIPQSEKILDKISYRIAAFLNFQLICECCQKRKSINSLPMNFTQKLKYQPVLMLLLNYCHFRPIFTSEGLQDIQENAYQINRV